MGAFRNSLVGFAGLLVLAAASGAASERPVRLDATGNPIAATAPSFDCAKVRQKAETLICSVGYLGLTDRAIAETYQRVFLHSTTNGREVVRKVQREWLRERNTCMDLHCVEDSLNKRLTQLHAQLESLDRTLRANISQVGQCEVTRIDFIGPRLTPVEGEPPDGTSVGFADGVRQVSYDREPQVLKSRLGDKARVCLVSVPHDCPPRDDRGRIYSVLDLRTQAKWKLPDASHGCGGA